MAYKRVISYFDFIEDEKKRGNAGFVKWEKYDECHILSVFINGLAKTLNKDTEIFLDERMLGTVSIRGGSAEGTFLLTEDEREEKAYIESVRIVLDDRHVLIAEFEKNKEPGGVEKTDAPVKEKEIPRENASEKQEEPVDVPVNEPAIVSAMAESDVKVWEHIEEIAEGGAGNRGTEDVLRQNDLWANLGETHEIFNPFNDGTECYRIFPKDLNLLQDEYRHFRSNQFLMHGYYNYRHLLIFKKKEETDKYWLGVPGIYHEREKMAAGMFGFEKFEAANKEYRVGDLGYYLVTVK